MGDGAIDATGPVVGPDSAVAESELRARRSLYRVTSLVLGAIMGFAVLDALGVTEAYGVLTAHVRDEGGGYELDVRYGTVSRPALATPFEIEVHRGGGFDGPVTLAVSHDYLRLWDENGLYPTPSSETTMGPWVVWEFEPPKGETLRFSYDARIEPGAQSGRTGRVAVLEDDEPVVDVSFRTQVRP